MTTTPAPAAHPPAAAGPHPAPDSAPPDNAPADRTAVLLRTAVIIATLPYLLLKGAWLTGSVIGVPEGSVLLDSDRAAVLFGANLLTLLMDLAVVGLAFALTRPWGLRLPAWLLALPLWVATGLLGPIAVAFPLQLLTSPLASGEQAPSAEEPFLESWVFGVVYGGFVVQAVVLGWLLLRYARQRWGHLLRDRGPWLGAAAGPAERGVALLAAALLVPAVALRVLWAAGAELALPAGPAGERTLDFHLANAVFVLFLLTAVAAALLLAGAADRPWRRISRRGLLLLGWTGGAVVACWGGWTLGTDLIGGFDGERRFPLPLALSYAAQVIAGLLLLAVGARLLSRTPAPHRAP